MRETYEFKTEPVNTQAHPGSYKVTWVEDGDGPMQERVIFVPMHEVHEWIEREHPDWLDVSWVRPDHNGEPVEVEVFMSSQEFVDAEMTDYEWIQYLKTRGIDIAPLNEE